MKENDSTPVKENCFRSYFMCLSTDLSIVYSENSQESVYSFIGVTETTIWIVLPRNCLTGY